jgi:hypothetical protein
MPVSNRAPILGLIGALLIAALHGVEISARQAPQTPVQSAPSTPPSAVEPQAVLNRYCISCHNEKQRVGGLSLSNLDMTKPGAHADVWERVLEKLRSGAMPPPGRPRPDAATYQSVAQSLETSLDRAWAANPNPGRISAVHRLNRTEYNNAIRDLLGLDIDVRAQLPGDETADGSFDKFADALSISTTHLERYLSVSRQVTRLATGLPPSRPTVETFEMPQHMVQDDRQSEDLPFGTRGGVAARHHFPATGEYRINVRLRRQYQEYLMGMGWPQQLDVRLDGKLLKRFTVGGKAQGRPAGASYAGDGEPGYAGDPEWEEYMQVGGDAGLEIRVPVEAGPHVVGVTFVREMWEPEGLPQPQQRGRVLTNDEVYMGNAAVGLVEIGGPFQIAGAAKDTPSRRKIFICEPKSERDEPACASRILSKLAKLAYRRPVNKRDVDTLLTFYTMGRKDGGNFDSGIQFALERLLVDPDFLLRVYLDRNLKPATASPASAYRLSDLEVASRLSFFLWSSIPDEQLLDLAERGHLTRPAILKQQVLRMLADPRAADALVDDFASQWLNLRRVAEVIIDPESYPDFDDNLLEAFRRETELFVASTLREDRSVLDLLRADYTFVNERLARHYRIPNVYGTRFRRVALSNPNERGGLLAQGSLLSTTSYPDRTSPVLRGKFLLNNILGLDVPQPPPGVDTNLQDARPGTLAASIRERLEQHRKNPSCASCHSTIDPLGFALENFDAIGGWRTADESGNPVDASGTTASGSKIEGLAGLRALLLERPEQFPRTLTEKLIAYALGRRLEHYDRPAVRKIVRDAAAHDYRWSSIVTGIVESPAFLMRSAHAATN